MDKVSLARTGLIICEPFFGSLAMKLEVVETENVPTFATDGRKLYYNPSFCASLSKEEIKGVLAHEVMHCAMNHMGRKGERHHVKWNVACDYAINKIIKDARLSLPEGSLLDDNFTGLSAEEIYSKLPKVTEQQIASAAFGEVLPSDGKSMEGEGLSKEEAEVLGKEWEGAAIQAAQVAKMVGRLPADLERMVLGDLFPQVDWITKLARFVKSTARDDYSWSRPNRRGITSNLYLPSLYSNKMGEMVVGIDTSGSITSDILNQFMSEVNAILDLARPEKIYVVYCDSDVAGVEEFTYADLPITANPKGGGGTSFSPVFEWVEDNGINPECLVYLTDMCCYEHGQQPGYPTMWVSTEKEYNDPPFGEVIVLGD